MKNLTPQITSEGSNSPCVETRLIAPLQETGHFINQNLLYLAYVFAFFFFAAFPLCAAELDLAYIEKFGYGTLLSSGKGLPQKGKFEESQFSYSDGKFQVALSNPTTLDLRSILPQDSTYETYFEKLRKDNPKLESNDVSGVIYWKFWASHDLEGKELVEKWPMGASQPPEIAPLAVFYTDLPVEKYPFRTVALSWEQNDLKEILGDWLNKAKPGYSLYVTHSVGFYPGKPQHTELKPDETWTISDPILSCIVEFVSSDPHMR